MKFGFGKNLFVACMALGLAAGHATVIVLKPTDSNGAGDANYNDLNDLDHDYAYQWKINDSRLAGQTITGVNLYIDNIRDWTIEDNDVLHVQLFNTSSGSGVTRYWDDEAEGNYFRNQGINLVSWHDLLPYTQEELKKKKTVDLSYNFTAAEIAILMSYASDGKFALGFDPDCHYYNDGIKLTVTYGPTPPPVTPVPEPGTMALFGVGLLGLAYWMRRKRA